MRRGLANAEETTRTPSLADRGLTAIDRFIELYLWVPYPAVFVTACLFGALAVTMDPHGRVRSGAMTGMVAIGLGAIVLQVGYVLAPWLVPNGEKALCLALMAPVTLFVLVLLAGEGTLRAGLVFSSSSASSSPASRNALSAYVLVLSYIVPPVLLLFHR